MSALDERDRIRAAADRLLAGTPLRSNGTLTIVSLAEEADVKRHVLTHRHTDLKDEFYARVRAQSHTPDSEQKLRERLDKAEEKIRTLAEKNTELQAGVEAYARTLNLLTVENELLRTTGSERTVVPLGRH